MDNKIFNVNGKKKNRLLMALKLLLLDEYGKEQKVKGWYFSKKKGFILTWYVGDSHKHARPFTNRIGEECEIDAEELVEILWDWLESDEARAMELEGWDRKFNDSDVSTDPGWRLYTDEWGHVNNPDGHTIDHYSIGALTKAYMWYGK